MIRIKHIYTNIKVSSRSIASFTNEDILNPQNKRRFIKRFTAIRLQKKTLHLPTQKRHAAVLVPLCYVNNELALLYTLRAADLKSHRGQISFPGGIQDYGDKTFIDTALRETNEELGISKDEVEIWCQSRTIDTPSKTSVTPVVGLIKNPNISELIVKNPKEVEDFFCVPLTTLCKPENCRYTQFRRNFSTPVFLGAPRRIWGLTAIITHLFLLSLMPKDCYHHVIKFTPTIEFTYEKQKE